MEKLEFKISDLEMLYYKVRKAVYELNELNYNEGLIMSMPQYFLEMLQHRFMTQVAFRTLPEGRVEFYMGCKIVPAYENKITVYHPFMLPQYPELVKSIEI